MPHLETIRNLAHRINLAFHRLFPEDNIHSITANRMKLYKLKKILPAEIRLRIMQDNITKFNAAVEKAALMQDCFKNNEILSASENIDSQIELLNYQFHNLKTKVEKSKTPEDNNKFKQTRPSSSFHNKITNPKRKV